MTDPEKARQRVMRFYDAVGVWMRPAVETLAEDPQEVVAAGRERLAGMLHEIPYVERPDHTMARSMFACAAMLAVYEVLRERGVDAHAWGRAFLALPPATPPSSSDADAEAAAERARADAAASQQGSARGEFVFEILGPDAESDRGMNVHSCAICHLFGRHDAADLVPYMCAYDDVTSDAEGEGLRRTGTLAVGASHCDFRFRKGGEPLRLADQYPERIRLRRDGSDG